MKPVSVILVATASTLVLSAAGWRGDRVLGPHDALVRREVARLRAHFDSVDVELRMRDVSHLSAEQRANRVTLIGWLREYREAGRFPLNDKFAGQFVPFFRDSRGTLCAMAYLVDRSGRSDVVDHIARTRNNALIRELTDDPRLVAWLDASGLSVSEAARIQPAYEGCCVIGDRSAIRNQVSGDYALLSIALSGSSLGTLGFNLFAPGRVSGAAGLLTGAASIIAGAARMGDIDGDRRVARANAGIGTLAVIGGLRGVFAQRASRDRVPVEASSDKGVKVTSLSPDLIVGPNATRVGLRLRAEF
ncbi:MAG TPA: hypothetical protein VFS56_06990 [Gemmatimonadaceae bacterium]|nr:hypothetical protein [Gemmatimonadaceae bacterium]